MRKFSMMPILVLAMALGFVSCSASDDGVNDGMLGQQTTTFMPSFSMLSYSQSASTPILQDGSNSAEMEEKLVCKILPGGKLMLTHKNVVFDDAVSIKMETTLVGNKLIFTENADYGVSGNYGYYTLNTTVGTLKDGNYTIVVMRNQNVRAEFQMSYDSSKAKNQ